MDEKTKLKFTSFFKNVVIELDKEAYGPDNHLSQWHRGNNEEELDGFTVSGCVCVCTHGSTVCLTLYLPHR